MPLKSSAIKVARKALSSIICPICSTPLIGLLEVDAWGNRYCKRHSTEYHRCTCCQRLICEPLTSGGVAYSDGRLVCNLCRRTAIDTKKQAKPYVEAVATWLYEKGFSFQNLSLRIELVGSNELAGHGLKRNNGELQGVIIKRGGVAISQRRVDGVRILKGLSRQVMEGVALHELGHAWLFLLGIDGLALPIEEGFCNLLAYMYHSETDTDEARFCMRVIEKSPDPVYGDGFRKVFTAVQHHGLKVVLQYLKDNQRLPG